MFRGSKRLVVAAAAVGMTLAIPFAALAGNGGKCNASACKVYVEQPLPNGTGGNGSSSSPPPSSSTTQTKAQATPRLSKRTVRALAHAGKDKAALTKLVQNPELFLRTREPSSGYGNMAAPSALSAAFDLGSGPTALFAALAGIAALLLAAAGLGAWRRRSST